MATRDDDGERVVPDRDGAKLRRRLLRQGGDREFDFAAEHRAAALLGIHKAKVEPRLWMRFAKRLQCRRQPV